MYMFVHVHISYFTIEAFFFQAATLTHVSNHSVHSVFFVFFSTGLTHLLQCFLCGLLSLMR